MLRTKAELQEQAEKAELEAQRKLSDERDKIRKAAQDQVIEEHRLKDADKNKQLEDMRRQIEDLKRKAEQGSQKLQGDVQEIELEKALRERFPRDQIESVKSGARGADVLQKVRSDSGQLCVFPKCEATGPQRQGTPLLVALNNRRVTKPFKKELSVRSRRRPSLDALLLHNHGGQKLLESLVNGKMQTVT